MTGHPVQKFSVGLKHILLGAGGGILLCCAVIAIHFLGQAQKLGREAQAEAEELARYEVVLMAVGAISSERGPSNNAMTSGDSAVIDALRQKRAETDNLLTDMREAYHEELSQKGRYSKDYALLKAHLRSARAIVDKVAALPPEERNPDMVAMAVHALFRSADNAFNLRDRLGSAIAARTQNLSAEILLLNAAGALREMTGRLGSHTVLILAGAKTAEDEQAAMNAIRAKLELLWHDLRLYASAHLKTLEVQAAIETTKRSYFLGSLPYLDKVLHLSATGQVISAKTFTDRYVRGLKAPDELRSQIIRATIESAQRRASDARHALLTGVTSFAMICCLLLGFALAAGRLLFSPLLSARDQILALAADNLDGTHRRLRASRELEEIFDGLAILRRQLLEKKLMEQEQQRLTETLRFLAERDPLTQLLNRRTVEELATVRMRDSDTNDWPLGVLIVDLDHFKRINDTHGHAVGDLVLKATADQMKRTLRSTDVVARFGGEEFLIILDLSDGTQAVEIAERLRRGIAAMTVEHEPPISVTASIGLCIRMPGTAIEWSEVLATADRRLYNAKAQGRNQVCAGDDDEHFLAGRRHALPSLSRVRALP